MTINTSEAVQYLRKAKSEHIKMRTYAQALASGLEIDESKAPISHAECDFGLWYSNAGQAVNELSSAFSDIEQPHESLHNSYEKIYLAARDHKLNDVKVQLGDMERVTTSLLSIIDHCIDDITQHANA